MNVNCSTCLELLTPSDELSSVPCGHIFHTTCILQWLETGKNNCPQCRTKCTEKQLRRIFFTEGVDLSTQTDSNTLQNRLDSINFQLRCSDTEKKNLREEVDSLTAKNVGLRDEYKCLEKKYKTLRDDTANMRNQIKLLQGERERGKLAVKKSKELQEKLRCYETIDIAVKGTLPQMMDRLQSMNDYSENAKQLCGVAEQLKKELTNKGTEVSRLHKALQRKANECGEYKTKFEENNIKVNELTAFNNRLKSDFEHSEDENQALKKKLEVLQDAITSPSGDPKSSAIARLVSEHPAPLKLNMTVMNSPPTPKAQKTCGLIALQNRKSPSFKRSASATEPPQNLFSKKSKLSSLSQPTERPTSSTMLHYDGFGGHSKKDIFPSSSRSSNIASTTKKNKSFKSTPKTDRKLQTLNKFFNFDTP